MMELTVKTAVICLVAALGAAFLKKGTPEFSMLLSVAAVAVVLTGAAASAEGIIAAVQRLIRQTGMEEELFTPLFKVVGISLVSRLGSELCKDAGQGALASLVELSGTLCAFVAAAPLFAAAAELFGGWMVS